MKGDDRQNAVDPRIDRVVSLIRNLPLRSSDRDGGDAEESVLARGWFLGADECARVLASRARLEICEGRGFGARWPILFSGDRTLAPALPVAAGEKTASGVDGEYRVDVQGVWREAGGVDCLFLSRDLSQSAPGAPFDLMWFGDFERFAVRGGVLEIEDLFGVLRVPASRCRLEHTLVRLRRAEADVLVGLPAADPDGRQTIEVRRPEDLIHCDRWRDASRFLEARADIESTRARGSIIEARVVGGASAVFGCDEDENGWLLTLRGGRYVFTQIRLARCEKALSLRATLDREIDAMAPGMRGRLIFGLHTDLVTLD